MRPTSFPIVEADRSIPAAPGARKRRATDDEVRACLTRVASRPGLGGLFAPLAASSTVDGDPDLGRWISMIGGRLLLAHRLAILPPEFRFARAEGSRYLFAVQAWANGVTGYAIGPAWFRPEISVYGHSEGGLMRAEEFASVGEWLLETLEPLTTAIVDGSMGDTAAMEAAQILWHTIEGDLPPPGPRPAWLAPVHDGVFRQEREGIVICEEHYQGGLRHGTSRRWALIEDEPALAPLDSDDADFPEPSYRQGPVIQEGGFHKGWAQGGFRFYDDAGRLLQEVNYQDGYPEGRALVHLVASTGLCDSATVDYQSGVPRSWQIPATAYRSVALGRAGGGSATLAVLAAGAPLLLLDCASPAAHDLTPASVRELESVPGLVIVGLHPSQAGRTRLAGRPVEIVVDEGQQLALAYGPDRQHLLPATFFAGDGRCCGASRLSFHRLAARFSGGTRL